MRYLFVLAVVALGFATRLTFAADNWPEFRGPHGNGVAGTEAPPTNWSEVENVRWKVPVHDRGWSSPVVWGEQVWVTTATEDGKRYFALGFDRKTGKTLHDLHLFDDPSPPDIRQYNSFASPTPAIEEGRLYAHYGSHGTACIDTATGKVVWQRRDLPCDHFRGPGSSVALYRDRLFLLFDGFDRQYVVCLSKATGETIWLKDRDLPYQNTNNPKKDNDYKKAFATPAVFEFDGKAQVVCPAAVGTIAYDVQNGNEVWRVITGGMNEACRPVLAHGLIYLTTGHLSGLVAVKAGMTGDITKSGFAWKADKIAPTRPSPLIVGDLLFMVNDTGIAFCFDAKTGAKHWQERLDGKFTASPVYAAGNVYFLGENGKAPVVAAKSVFELVVENKLEAGKDGCKASPAVAGGNLFVRTTTHLYCIGKD